MDMTKDMTDFELKLEYEPSDYTMTNTAAAATEAEEEAAVEQPETVYEITKEPAEPAMDLAAQPESLDEDEAQANDDISSAELTEKNATAMSVEETPNPETSPARANEPALTPPPRPLTTSELVGLSEEAEEPELRLQLSAKKSRSLPNSPQPLAAQQLAAAALFEFGQAAAVVATADRKPKQSQKAASPAQRKVLRGSGIGEAANSQQFCLRWNNYQSNLTNVFDELLQSESFVDVTLACEGHSIKAHKMVLSACSPYFQALFYDNPCQHPIIIMRDVNWTHLKALVEFMYKGEINVCQDQINPLLKVAETLKIRGLAEVSAGAHGAGASAHPMLPEQRMTVYNDDEDDELTAAMRGDDDDEDELKPKRARLLAKLQAESALDLNQRQRKRSRDGQLLDNASYATPSPLLSETLLSRISDSPAQSARSGATPNPQQLQSQSQSQAQPLAMTTSTIVRNPFASPNPQALRDGPSANAAHLSGSSSSASSSSGASTAGNSSSASATSSSVSTSSSAASVYRSSARSCSPPPHAGHSNGSAAAAAAAAAQLSSPTGGANGAGNAQASTQQQLHAHLAHHAQPQPPPPPGMHHHAAAAAAQQLAAQHQLHAAAQSHAAMASALGASLAAAAAGGSGTAGQAAAGPSSGAANASTGAHHDDMEIKPEIAEMIREEERAKMIESGGHGWMGAATGTSVADSYQYQLQSMWQKCWNTNQQNLVQQLRFRERGPLKSWRPEAMAEAIFSVLKEGLSLSQAARKFDIPYPTFVLYANRVHNMLGPSLDGGTDPRPKARGRPQRILLGMWPEELIRSVIKAVVFRDYREIKEDMSGAGHQYANGQSHAPAFGPGSANAAVAANGYHSAAKLAAQNAALATPDSNSPLSSMTETLRRQILSQQQQSPMSQSMNMYKSPAYLQRSEIEDQVSAAAAAAKHQQGGERRGSENLPDLSALGLMGLPGLNVMPSQQAPQQRASAGGNAGAQMHPSAASYARERERELSRDRERERELKEAMQARQYGSQARGSSAAASSKSAAAANRPGAASPYSPYSHYNKQKEHPNYAYNKRFLESLPAGIDFEAIANGLLQKSVNKSPRFEDFFPGQDMSELFASADSAGANAAAAAAAAAAAYAPAAVGRGSPLMKIKLEQQPAAEVPHED